MNPSVRKFWQNYRISVLLLAVISLVSYGRSAFTPSLLGDEWGHLNSYINSEGPLCPHWQTPRPFGACLLWVVYNVVGLNLYAYHAVAVIISLLSALVLLILLEQLLPGRTLFNGAVAALFLVYPADMTRTWLAGNIVYATAIYLTAACFLAAFWRHGRWWTWIVGMLILLVAIGTYEISFGVTMMLSVGAFVWPQRRSAAHRLALLAPALVVVSFSVWRWLWQLSVGTAYGYSSENVYFSPAILASSLISGYRINLQWVWTDIVLRLVPPLQIGARASGIAALLILASIILLAMLAVSRFARKRYGLVTTSEKGAKTQYAIKDLARIAVIGLLVLGAGYLPGILAVLPGMGYEASRAQHLPSIGAATFVAAVLFGVARLWTGDSRRIKLMVLAGLVPLLMLGIASQLLVQQRIRSAWFDQRQIWQSMFKLAPDVAAGTHIVLVLDGYDVDTADPGPFISGPWGISGALATLYRNSELDGRFFYGSANEVLTSKEGKPIVSDNRETGPTADETLVFVFDKASQQLRLLETLETDGHVMLMGTNRILQTPAQETDYRYLVLD